MLDSHDTPGARPLIWIGLASFVLPANAHAYLDPGTGSLVLQAIIGFILAMGMTTKIWWRRSKRFFLRIIKHRQPTDTDGE